jgi:hypothetical protein
MPRYFKTKVPSLEGYTMYFEYEGEWVTRQIDIYQGTILLMEVPEASDVRFSEADLSTEHEISHQEFERLWETYLAQPHGTKRTDNPLVKGWLDPENLPKPPGH